MIDSLLEPYINEKIDKFNENSNRTLDDGYAKFNKVLSQIVESEKLMLELEYLYNLQINEAIRLAYIDAMKQGFQLGVQLMDEIRREL